MSRSFRKLLDELSPERRRRIARSRDGILRAIALRELRRARSLTQEQLAEALDIRQASLSKMEGQSDMYVSTLRRILEAMGGRLKIVAEFPEGDVEIDQFDAPDTADGEEQPV